MKKFLSTVLFSILILAMPGCRLLSVKPEESKRETIFDRVVSIPEKIVYDIPHLPPLCDEIAGLKKGFADIKNGKIYYEEEGEGDPTAVGFNPIVLINGGPGATHHGFHPYFSQIKDMSRVIYYDQRGTGKSSSDYTGKTYTVKQAVEDLESLRKELKIDRWIVLGWSYGGLLAQCYALAYPDRVTGLVLGVSDSAITSNSINPKREREFISQAELDAMENIQKKGGLTPTQIVYNEILCGSWKRDRYYRPTTEEVVRVARYGSDSAPGFEELMRSSMNNIRLKGKFADFEVPTLIVEGKWELAWWNTDRVELLSRNHPNAQIEIFEKSGHNVFADEPDKFFKILRKFIKESSSKNVKAKAGSRLTWPEPIVDSGFLRRISAMIEFIKDKKERKKAAFEIYEEAVRENVEGYFLWYNLVKFFISTKNNFEKCLIALERLEASAKKRKPKLWEGFGFCIFAWQGHMLDLLGRRDEAIIRYKKALEALRALRADGKNWRSENSFNVQILINIDFLEDRLKIPFSWDIIDNREQ